MEEIRDMIAEKIAEAKAKGYSEGYVKGVKDTLETLCGRKKKEEVSHE